MRRRCLVEQVIANDEAPAGLTLRYFDRFAAFFRDELAVRRTRGERLDLHRRAAAVSPPMRAIELLLAVGDIDAASNIVVEVGPTFLDSPGGRVPRSWLAPFDDDRSKRSPGWLLSGLTTIEDGDVSDGDETDSHQRWRPCGCTVITRVWCGAPTDWPKHLAWGQVAEASELIGELLGLHTSPDDRAKMLMGKLWLDYFGGDWAARWRRALTRRSPWLSRRAPRPSGSVALGLGTEFLFATTGVIWLSDRVAELAHRIDRDVMALTNLELVGAAAAPGIGPGRPGPGDLGQPRRKGARVGQPQLVGDGGRPGTPRGRARHGRSTHRGHHRQRSSPPHERVGSLPPGTRRMYAYAAARSGPPDGRAERIRAAPRVLLGDVERRTALTPRSPRRCSTP